MIDSADEYFPDFKNNREVVSTVTSVTKRKTETMAKTWGKINDNKNRSKRKKSNN